jgi:hypothetical protein
MRAQLKAAEPTLEAANREGMYPTAVCGSISRIRPPVASAGHPSPGITGYTRLLAPISGGFPRGICAG